MRYCEYTQQLEYAPIKSKEEILKVLREKVKDGQIKRWAYILHNKDTYSQEDIDTKGLNVKVGDKKPEHFHIMIELKSDRTPVQIAKWFDDKPNYINNSGSQGKAYAYLNMIEYMFHNTPSSKDKAQYKHDEAIANFDIEKFLIKAHKEADESAKKANSRKNAQEEKEYIKQLEDDICEAINNGVPPYKISKMFFSGSNLKYADKFKGRIPKWYEAYYEVNPCNKRKGLTTTWICGASGSGKNSLARYYARQEFENEDIIEFDCNIKNCWDNYNGQPCIILQDFRDYERFFGHLCNLLDPNASTQLPARYSNKDCRYVKRIFITNTLDIDRFLENSEYVKQTDGNSYQLKRRIQMKVYIQEIENGDRLVEQYVFDKAKGIYKKSSENIEPFDQEQEELNYFDMVVREREVYPAKLNGDKEISPILKRLKEKLPKESYERLAKIHNENIEANTKMTNYYLNLSDASKKELKTDKEKIKRLDLYLDDTNPFVQI